MPELLPCPFCGGEASLSSGMTWGKNDVPYVECLECAASSNMFNTEKETVQAWNKRKDFWEGFDAAIAMVINNLENCEFITLPQLADLKDSIEDEVELYKKDG